MRAAVLLAFSALLFACGGSEPPPANPAPAVPSAPSPGGAPGPVAEKHEDHGAMKPALHDFHEVLAPMWHSTAGTERITKTCAAQSDLKAKATAVADAELQADVDAVKAACDKADHADVESKLSVVHDRFHKLVEGVQGREPLHEGH